ncbi:t-SNARE [Zopfochytrium polystomum]|nr:t-SNARE [Zopfochytrium polystomum]
MARDSPSEPLVDRKPVNRTGGRPNPRPTNAQPPANGGETTGEAGDTLSSFLAQVGEIQQDVSRLEQNMQQIRNIQSRILGSTMADEAANLNRQLDRLNDETSGLLQSCRKRLKQLSVATANMKPSNEKHTRKLQQSSVAKRLLEVADEFQKIQASFKQRYKQRMAREIKNARPDATPAEIERALDSNIGSAFSQQLLSSRNAQSRRVLQEVQTRQEALVKLEQSMTELVALFQEMQALLEVQQEVINEVEVHVETTVQHLEDGSKEMTRAVASAKSARKSKWYILVIVLVLLVIAAIVTYIYVSNLFVRLHSHSTSTTLSF